MVERVGESEGWVHYNLNQSMLTNLRFHQHFRPSHCFTKKTCVQKPKLVSADSSSENEDKLENIPATHEVNKFVDTSRDSLSFVQFTIWVAPPDIIPLDIVDSLC
jgi:hypothetical protein